MTVRDILHHYIGCKADLTWHGQADSHKGVINGDVLYRVDSYSSIVLHLKDLKTMTESQADEMNLESNFKPHLKGMDEPLFTAEEIHTLTKNGYNVFELKEPEIILI